MDMEIALKFLGVLGMLALVAIILGLPLMLLWNWVIPGLFGLPAISFWQAVGINLISSILFKSNVTVNKN